MGRQLRRVPLDFGWPLNKPWNGFINPHYKHRSDCPACDGSGYSPDAKRISDQWYGKSPFTPNETGSELLTPDTLAVRQFVERQLNRDDSWYRAAYCTNDREALVQAEGNRLCEMWNCQWAHHLDADDVAALVEAERLHDLTHTWTRETGWQKKAPAVMPTPQQVNAWAILTMGHDAINRSICIRAKCARLGIKTECNYCDGDGDYWDSTASKARYEAWKETDPPAGDGYQLWETVSEGSPITPVFAKPEELAAWLVENDDSVTKDTGYEGWMKFICGKGWAPSMVGTASGIKSGVAFIADHAATGEGL